MNIFVSVLLYGSLWGIAESTLGHVLHVLHFPSGSIMFPIGLAFMFFALNNTKDVKAVLYTALLASFIKSVDAFVPGYFLPIRPMMAIVAEGLVVFSMISFFVSKKEEAYSFDFKSILVFAFSSSLLWRILVLILTYYLQAGSNSRIIMSVANLMDFLMNGIYNGIIISLAYLLLSKIKITLPKFVFNPITASLVFVLALGTEFLF